MNEALKTVGQHDGEKVTDGTVSAKDVVMRYGNIMALDHLSMEIPTGIVGLLGPNGAGKSTFIKAVLGLVEPQERHDHSRWSRFQAERVDHPGQGRLYARTRLLGGADDRR